MTESVGDEAPPLVAIFADESCLGNGREGENPGGAGVVVEYQRATGELVRRDVWISEPATTNNRMALRSVIEAFSALGKKGRQQRIVFTTDSRYIVDGMSTWVHDWARRGWKRKAGPIENLELWQEAVRAAVAHEVSWRWVKGHAGHAQNEYANILAIRAAEEQTQSGGLVNSGYDEWALGMSAGRTKLRLEPFPNSDGFKAASRLPHIPAGRQ
ncbi:MAG: ribonuclease H [Gemmatimonadaceae bacterium]